jgi:peptide deformylase
MIREIKQYPIPEGFEFGGTVRHFDETLFALVEDLKETLEANELEALCAFQIGSPLAVIVIKHNDNYLELMNPVIITREGSITPTEKTAYFPHLTATTKRYEKIKVMYENREGKQQFLSAEGDLAIVIQRKTDYLLGANFRLRMSKEEQSLFDAKLNLNTNEITPESCPTTTLPHQYILTTIKYGLILGLMGIIVSFFLTLENLALLQTIENYLMIALFLLVGLYVAVAQHEGKRYKTCTSCQISNILGIAVIKIIHITGLFLANYFLL